MHIHIRLSHINQLYKYMEQKKIKRKEKCLKWHDCSLPAVYALKPGVDVKFLLPPF